MSKHAAPLIPVKGPNTEAPESKPVTITITTEQVQGIVTRRNAVNRLNDELNHFLSGVVAGHGLDVVQITGLDEAKRTLTLIKVRVDKSVENK